jgi:hypothetical protein
MLADHGKICGFEKSGGNGKLAETTLGTLKEN